MKAPPGDVARSAKEFDARQIIRVDGQDDKEQEVWPISLVHSFVFTAVMYIFGAMWIGGSAYHSLWHCCDGRQRQSHHS